MGELKKQPFVVPPFDMRSKGFVAYKWWSWHPNYPYWSESCWGGSSVEEAKEALKNHHSADCYHNKLIEFDGRSYREVLDMPCERIDVWERIKQMRNK